MFCNAWYVKPRRTRDSNSWERQDHSIESGSCQSLGRLSDRFRVLPHDKVRNIPCKQGDAAERLRYSTACISSNQVKAYITKISRLRPQVARCVWAYLKVVSVLRGALIQDAIAFNDRPKLRFCRQMLISRARQARITRPGNESVLLNKVHDKVAY